MRKRRSLGVSMQEGMTDKVVRKKLERGRRNTTKYVLRGNITVIWTQLSRREKVKDLWSKIYRRHNNKVCYRAQKGKRSITQKYELKKNMIVTKNHKSLKRLGKSKLC